MERVRGVPARTLAAKPFAAHLGGMTLLPTLTLTLALAALAVFAGWRGSLPSQPHRGVRMIPWRLVMLLAGAAVFLLAVHLAALLGAPQRGV